MQKFNKSMAKNTFYHTWFIYPVAATVLTLIWLWSFPVFHTPSAHQKINVFFATDVTSENFTKPILEKYNKEDLRQINPSYALPGTAAYYQKCQIALSNCDILILTKSAVETYKSSYDTYFAPITSYVQEKVGIEESKIKDEHAILFREQGVAHYLDEYMTFIEEDYYLVFSITSKNLGSAINEDNGPYDNALSFAKYLIEGV